MEKEKQLKRAALHNGLLSLIILVILIAVLISLQACNTEKKALKPYKTVVNDVDTSFKAKKKELGARYCAVNFPIETKIETITKYLPGKKIIVKDSVGLLRMANFYESKMQGKQCFTGFELDSIINDAINEIEPTKIYTIDTFYTSNKSTGKDTTGSYFKQQIFDELNQKKILAETNLQACSNDYKETIAKLTTLENKQSNLGYSFNIFIGNLWHKIKWWLILAALLFAGYKFLKGKINLIGWVKDKFKK